MTCKDCIHRKACKNIAYEYAGEDAASAYDEDSCCKPFAETCANFSDKSEWFHLFGKIGSELYVICHDKNKCEFCVVMGKLNKIWIGDCAVYSVSLLKDDYVFRSEDFNKTVFLTREEAERALEERTKNQ